MPVYFALPAPATLTIDPSENIAKPIRICYNADRQKRDGYIVCTPVENPGAATPGFSYCIPKVVKY